jgi:hypothetical protein
MSSVASDNLPRERPLAAVGQDGALDDFARGGFAHHRRDEKSLIRLLGNAAGQAGGLLLWRADAFVSRGLHGFAPILV